MLGLVLVLVPIIIDQSKYLFIIQLCMCYVTALVYSTDYVCPCAVDMTVIFTFSCSFVCTGQHAALCVSMSQAVGSLRTAPICALQPTTSPMKALRSTSRCGDCCTPTHHLGVNEILVS